MNEFLRPEEDYTEEDYINIAEAARLWEECGYERKELQQCQLTAQAERK